MLCFKHCLAMQMRFLNDTSLAIGSYGCTTMLDKMLILFALKKKMQREGVFSDFFIF